MSTYIPVVDTLRATCDRLPGPVRPLTVEDANFNVHVNASPCSDPVLLDKQ